MNKEEEIKEMFLVLIEYRKLCNGCHSFSKGCWATCIHCQRDVCRYCCETPKWNFRTKHRFQSLMTGTCSFCFQKKNSLNK
jgi:hypothetical protein